MCDYHEGHVSGEHGWRLPCVGNRQTVTMKPTLVGIMGSGYHVLVPPNGCHESHVIGDHWRHLPCIGNHSTVAMKATLVGIMGDGYHVLVATR